MSFSVIVPTLDEEAVIGDTLSAARRGLGEEAELVVVDGGSEDRTRERAAGLARVLHAPPCRGGQMNAGALAATGSVLVFLHADTRLHPESGEHIRAALSRPGVVGGCFRFAVDPPPPPVSRFGLLETAVDLRTRLFRTATGDQVIFARREAFEAAGGFPDFPLLEDVAFVRDLRRLGRFEPLPVPAVTSRRRWESNGFWSTVFLHWVLRAAFTLGVSPHRLARWYEDGRISGPSRS